MEKKYFIGTCVENPFEEMDALVNVVDNYSQVISKNEFLKHCFVDPEIQEKIKQYPNDFEFYKSKTRLFEIDFIYFYSHSGIEYFYA